MASQAKLKKLIVSKDGGIIVAHPSSSIRGQIVNILKDLGFTAITGVSDIPEVAQLLNDAAHTSPPPAWVLTALFADEKSNALQLGRLINDTPQLQALAWSLITSQDEAYAIPYAIENGVLSWHTAEKFSLGNAIHKEIMALFDLAGRLKFETDLISLVYTRLFLKVSDSYESLLKLTGSMVELRPDNSEFLFNYADAMALNNQVDSARKFATRAFWADKNLIPRAGELVELDGTPIFNDEEIKSLGSSSSSVLSAFGLSKCMIVDPDAAARKHLRAALEGMGIQEVLEFEDGQTAWEHLKTQSANTLLICEWKLPKLSAMALLQRMRQQGIHGVPVIISSAQLGPQDKGLLEELGSAVLLQKPLSLESLDANIRIAVKEENLPSSFKGVIRKVRGLLRKNDVVEAKKLWDVSIAEMLVPGSEKKMVAAEILMAEGKLEEAYAEAQISAAMGARGAYFFNLLGKITFALGDFDSSATWFYKANKIVPINIDRLTELATVEMHRGDTDKATEIAGDAAKIDALNPKVIETHALVALEKGDSEEAAAIMAELNDLMNIVSHLNNRAVAMAWQGDHDKGIALYREALIAAPNGSSNNQNSFATSVAYNLALALARKGDLDAAEKTIAGLKPDDLNSLDDQLSLKIGGFKKRVKEAIKTGAKMEIEIPKTSDVSKKRIQNLAKASKAAIAKAGNLAKSMQVFGTIDYRSFKFTEKKLRFNPKKT